MTAIRANSGFTATAMPREDDSPSSTCALGFGIKFFSTVAATSVYLNENGNITFNGPLPDFTPTGITASVMQPLIAVYWADVDTRNPASGITAYGPDTVDGHAAWGATWPLVGYYNSLADKLNTFQLVLISRPDTGDAGNFDIEFNYRQIKWETGTASNGITARAGYTNGASGAARVSAELTGSGSPGAFLDGGGNALISGTQNAGGVLGRYVFPVRAGAVVSADMTHRRYQVCRR